MDLKKVKYKDGPWTKDGYVEVPSEPKSGPKMEIRSKMQTIGGNEDNIADLAKMLSLTISMLDRMYETFTETQKGRMSAEDRAIIEYLFAMKRATITTGDIDFAMNPEGTIDKLLNREGEKGKIVKEVKGL